MVALLRRPLFPGAITPVTVTDPAILKALEEMERMGCAALCACMNAQHAKPKPRTGLGVMGAQEASHASLPAA